MSQTGFTLIEIIVALVIVGLMFAIVPPRLDGALERMQGKTAARELITELKQARNHAINLSKSARLVINIEKNTLTLDDRAPEKLSDKIKLGLLTAQTEQISDQAGAIRFFPDGSSTGGRIKVATDQLAYYVDINWLTGKIALAENVDPENWNKTSAGSHLSAFAK